MAALAAVAVATTRWTTCLAAWEEVVRLAGSVGVTRTAGLEAGQEGTRTGSEAVKPRDSALSLGIGIGVGIKVGGKERRRRGGVYSSPQALSIVSILCKPSIRSYAPNRCHCGSAGLCPSLSLSQLARAHALFSSDGPAVHTRAYLQKRHPNSGEREMAKKNTNMI